MIEGFEGRPIVDAVRSARDYLAQQADEALSTDSAAHARLGPTLRVRVEGPNGWQLETAMAEAVGGDGSGPSPGWVMRAALASCDAVLIAMQAAEDGIRLTRLETKVSSESDDRGLLGMGNAPAGPLRVFTKVWLEADGTGEDELRELVERALRRSPVSDALRRAVPVRVEVRTGPLA